MARVTVQDAVAQIGNRFDLILTAARRARQLQLHKREALVPEDGDKPTVIALREIELGLISDAIMNQQEHNEKLEREKSEIDMISFIASE